MYVWERTIVEKLKTGKEGRVEGRHYLHKLLGNTAHKALIIYDNDDHYWCQNGYMFYKKDIDVEGGCVFSSLEKLYTSEAIKLEDNKTILEQNLNELNDKIKRTYNLIDKHKEDTDG